jgi:N-acetylmuramoyl-L-alanine amidase
MNGLPLEPGSQGESVRDLHRRLARLGIEVVPAEPASYGPATEQAVRQFQHRRGLVADGVCDRATWSALVEANYRLGDRLLYLRAPMLRGDDVAELQRRLGSLGFDAGRVDGILGPATERALKDFQRNAGLTTDGVCGRDVLASLGRISTRIDESSNVAGVREREMLRRAPRVLGGRRVVLGDAGGLSAVANALERHLHGAGAIVAVLHHPDLSVQAAEANLFDADLYLGMAIADAGPCRVTYYATQGFESAGGRLFAEHVAYDLATAAGLDVAAPEGMRLPVLRETRMPAVMTYVGPARQIVATTADLAKALSRSVTAWAEAPVDA